MKKLLISVILVLALLGFSGVPTKAEAAPSIFANFKIPNAAKIRVDSEFTNNNHTLNLYFSNLIFVRKATYELTYDHAGGSEGVVGEITPKGKFVVKKSIILGACSGNDCTFHTGVDNMKLKVTTKYNLFNITETKTYNVNH